MNLEKYRKLAGLSQKALAEKSNLTQAHISHLEKRRRRPERMSLGDCRAIVATLNDEGVECTIDDVFPLSPDRDGEDLAACP